MSRQVSQLRTWIEGKWNHLLNDPVPGVHALGTPREHRESIRKTRSKMIYLPESLLGLLARNTIGSGSLNPVRSRYVAPESQTNNVYPVTVRNNVNPRQSS